MTLPAYEPYEPWDLARPAMTERSRLYALEPIGLGTSDVESLTGYVARLAAAHCLRTRALVREEILPLLGRHHLLKPINGSLSTFWRKDGRGINGVGPYAREWVGAVERLTLHRGLRPLTMLPWSGVLPRHGLLRAARAWCPACYHDRRNAAREPYDALLWALRIVTVCPHHRQPLRDRCPHADCGRPQSVLAPLSRPGYCAHCLRWLGAPPAHPGEGELEQGQMDVRVWQARMVGELLAVAPALAEEPARERIAEALTAIIEAAAGGNIAAFARSLGLDTCTVWQWTTDVNLPSLDLLVRVCAHQGMSLLHVLTGQRGGLDAVEVMAPPSYAPPCRPLTPRVPRDGERLRRAMETALDEDPPPSILEVARRLDFRTATSLYDRFPDLCRALAERGSAYRRARHEQWQGRLRDEVRQATLSLYRQGIYPASVRVPPLLSRPGHFRHPVATAAWRDTMRELDLPQDGIGHGHKRLDRENTR